METRQEERARKIARWFGEHRFQETGICSSSERILEQNLTDEITSALAQEREAALEEAAKVAAETVMSSGDHGTEIAFAIRQLKEKKE